VKVLDFGLAKLIRPPEDAPELPHSPAYTTGYTKDGVLFGTAAYMSPEQVRGQAVDNRADIWAFGCVLYEILSGRRAFQGDEVSDILAGILRDDPAWDALPASTPQSVRQLVRRCLEKDRRERLQAIGDARLEISEALTRRTDDKPTATPRSHTSRAKSIVPLAAVAGATALVVGIGTWMMKPSSSAAERLIARFLIAVDPFDQCSAAIAEETGPSICGSFRTAIAVSPDGRTLVFIGRQGVGQQGRQLFLRPLDRLEAAPIPGTEGAQNPFFSPDGAWIGYWADREIRRVPTAGGPPSTVARLPSDNDGPLRTPSFLRADTDTTVGASWGDGDVIVFATPEAVWRVASSGGTPEVVTKPGEGEYAYKLPQMLPGGRAVLFTLQKTLSRWDDAQIVVRSLVTGEQKVLLDDGADARYVPSGHLVFVRRGTLMAVPFDPARLTLTGAPVAMIDGVMQAANNVDVGADSGAGQFAIAAQGRLIYVTGGITPDQARALVWVDRNGNAEPLVAPRLEYLTTRLAPNGQRVVVSGRPPSAKGVVDRIWIHDIARESFTPLTSQEESSMAGVWSPDGARIVFSSILPGRSILSWKSVDGPGSSDPLGPKDRTFPPFANSWSAEGKIAFVHHDDIWELSVTDRRAQPVVQTPANEWHPAFSSDGKWLAYTSDHSGLQQVYVQPYPGPGPRVPVSTDGGSAPAWSNDGSELFYLTYGSGAKIVMNAVPVKIAGSQFSAGASRKLFEGRYGMTAPFRSYDVTPDGQRFLMIQLPDPRPSRPQELVLVENWLDELRSRVPSKP
jgi:Tol biopolymer transport system component